MANIYIALVIFLTIIIILAVLSRASPKDTFRPQRVACPNAEAPDPDPNLHRWAGQRNQNWTTVVTPWDPDSRIQLESAALTPSTRAMHLPINPVTRIGVTSRVRNWDNPYARNDLFTSPCSDANSLFDLQPFQPGFLAPKQNESTDNTPAQGRYYFQPEYWSRASGPYGGPYTSVASCSAGCASAQSEKAARDSADAPTEPKKETLRSRGNYRSVASAQGGDGGLTGRGLGLGSTWIDPRFEPGPQDMYDGGAAIYAHGGHAGGPTFGSFTPSVFQSSGGWLRYVHGFGDGDLIAPENRVF